MKKVPRAFHFLLGLSLLSISSIIILFSFFTYHRVFNELNLQSRQMMVNRAATVRDLLSTRIEETAARMLSIMTFVVEEDLSEESKQRVLDEVASSIVGCKKIWIYQPYTSTVTDSSTNQKYLDNSSWWKAVLANTRWQTTDLYHGNYIVVIDSENPFKDELELNTIVPISFSLLAGVDVACITFVEIDLTTLLITELGEHGFSLMDQLNDIEFSIYDRSGVLLETSQNSTIHSVFTLSADNSNVIPFDDERFLTGAIFLERDSKIYVYIRDEELGFVYRGSLPREVIVNRAQRVAFGILIIGFLCLLAVWGTGMILAHAYRKMKQYEESQALIRFQSLQSKMNPHFLFNTLDSIVGVAEQKNTTVLLDMLRNLSYILRMNLRYSKNTIPLSDELRYIDSYVALQKIRYKEQFSFESKVNVDVESCTILRFCLQPIIENCFVHAVALRKGFISITMTIWVRDDTLICEIINSGTNSNNKEKLFVERLDESTRHLGLVSIHKRLRILYGEEFGIEVPDDPDHFRVRVKLPSDVHSSLV